MGDVIVSLQGVVKRYRRGGNTGGDTGGSTVEALAGADLTLRSGEVVILRGRSGSGKTTLLNVLAGWQQPDAGTVDWADDLATADHAWDQVAIIPQALGLLAELTVDENIALPGRLAGRREPVEALMRALDIAHLGGRRPSDASLGEQQRAAVGRGLLLRPQLILADEPAAHQDLERLGLVWGMLRASADAGAGVLAASHNPEDMRYADRVVDVRGGRLYPRHE